VMSSHFLTGREAPLAMMEARSSDEAGEVIECVRYGK
jgi:hypothetical protein